MKENKRELKVHEADETASAAFRSERREHQCREERRQRKAHDYYERERGAGFE